MGPWLIKALNLGLLLASCFLVADIVTEIGAEALEPDRVQTPAERVERVATAPSAAPSKILERNLFGAQLAGEVQITLEDEEQSEPLTATKLPLRLLGTAAASREERSRAAIEDEKTKKHLVVGVGDPLEGHRRVSVKAIERSRVILDNAGRPEELALHEDDPNARPRARPRRNARQARRSPRAQNASLNDRLKALGGEDGQGISKILSSARIVPHYQDGEMLGMKVDSIKSDSVFERVGLENGDVITEVNGIVIDRLEATSAIFDEFASADEISVSATRGNEAVILSASASEIMEQQ